MNTPDYTEIVEQIEEDLWNGGAYAAQEFADALGIVSAACAQDKASHRHLYEAVNLLANALAEDAACARSVFDDMIYVDADGTVFR